jgi:hypothetical protein
VFAKTLTSAQVRFDMFHDRSHDTCGKILGGGEGVSGYLGYFEWRH